MSRIAIIVAGGSGTRMGENTPKQFIEISNKPILVHTLETFQKHPLIDAVEVVCLNGWQDTVRNYVGQYGLNKLKWVVPGGSTVQESIRNGVFFLEGKVTDEDIIIIHDGIRPALDEKILTDVIRTSEQYGNAVSSLQYNEQLFVADDDISTVKYFPREGLRRVSTPQAYRYGKLKWAYHEAYEKKIGIGVSAYANTLMADFGERLYFAAGSEKNIKLTTKEDLELFKACLKLVEEKN